MLSQDIIKIETVHFVKTVEHDDDLSDAFLFADKRRFRNIEAKMESLVVFWLEEFALGRPGRVFMWCLETLQNAYVVRSCVVDNRVLRYVVIFASAKVGEASVGGHVVAPLHSP